MTISDFTSVIVAVATVGTLLYISRQVTVTRQQTRGQFLLALDQQFEKSNAITMRLVTEPLFTPVGTEWYEIYQLMSVFERISIMVDDKILDIGLVDRLYGFRLLRLIANDAIYQRLMASGAEWQDFIDCAMPPPIIKRTILTVPRAKPHLLTVFINSASNHALAKAPGNLLEI